MSYYCRAEHIRTAQSIATCPTLTNPDLVFRPYSDAMHLYNLVNAKVGDASYMTIVNDGSVVGCPWRNVDSQSVRFLNCTHCLSSPLMESQLRRLSEQWYIHRCSDDAYWIQNLGTEKYLHTNSVRDGTPVDCGSTTHFNIVPDGRGDMYRWV